jgi:hypothetical protein
MCAQVFDVTIFYPVLQEVQPQEGLDYSTCSQQQQQQQNQAPDYSISTTIPARNSRFIFIFRPRRVDFLLQHRRPLGVNIQYCTQDHPQLFSHSIGH